MVIFVIIGTSMLCLRGIAHIWSLSLALHIVAGQVAFAAESFRIMGSHACVRAQCALFESVALIITSSAQFASVNFANAFTGNAAVQALLQSFLLW